MMLVFKRKAKNKSRQVWKSRNMQISYLQEQLILLLLLPFHRLLPQPITLPPPLPHSPRLSHTPRGTLALPTHLNSSGLHKITVKISCSCVNKENVRSGNTHLTPDTATGSDAVRRMRFPWASARIRIFFSLPFHYAICFSLTFSTRYLVVVDVNACCPVVKRELDDGMVICTRVWEPSVLLLLLLLVQLLQGHLSYFNEW